MESSISLTRGRQSESSSSRGSWVHSSAVGEGANFSGRINRKLSLVFGSFFLLVLVGGGTSLYLAGSLLIGSQKTAQEAEQVYTMNQLHSTLHHFFSTMQRARLSKTAISESLKKSYMTELKFLLASYEQAGGAPANVAKLHEIIADVEVLSERSDRAATDALASPPGLFASEELRMIEATEQRIQIFAHRLRANLEAKQRRDIQETLKKMKITAGFNAVFMILAALCMIGSSLYFYRSIALPLRRLAHAAREITDWKIHKELPITSRDEIGALSYALNTMSKELRKHEESLKGLATIEERERIAQELHDSVAQDLALIHLKLADVESVTTASGNTGAQDTVREVRKIAADSYDEVRQAIFGLRPMASKNLRFIPALREYLSDFSRKINIPIDLIVTGSEITGLSPLMEIQLIRIIHEALSNVFKHAQATAITVAFERVDKLLKVAVEDNGKGIVADKLTDKKFHFGLQTMKERAEALGGRLTIDSRPSKGTRVVVLFPLEDSSNETDPATSG
jgi:signal transduction histidine kinase